MVRLFCVTLLSVASAMAQEPATFGTAVVIPAGLRGEIYELRKNTRSLPNFSRLKPTGTIYTTSLDITPRDFQQGFPGITDRFEWFAIDYTGRFWIERPDDYVFVLTSDDGARLYIDGKLAIDNDGEHPTKTDFTRVRLEGGIHRIRISYFQGRRYHVALVLKIAGTDEPLRVFSTDEFKPPPNPEDWRFGEKQ